MIDNDLDRPRPGQLDHHACQTEQSCEAECGLVTGRVSEKSKKNTQTRLPLLTLQPQTAPRTAPLVRVQAAAPVEQPQVWATSAAPTFRAFLPLPVAGVRSL